jgi:hypothetical protein
MKSIFFSLLIYFTCLFLAGCGEDNNTNDANPVQFVKVTPGGCNLVEQNELKSFEPEGPDTVFYLFKNDTLHLNIGINYICCAPFTSETRITADSIFITLSDTCPAPVDNSCYCRCMCYYTWEMEFVITNSHKYYYRIFLDDPREEDTIIFREGEIIH